MSSVHLRRRLVLEHPERMSDGAGGFVQSWAVLGVLWADLRLGSGREAEGEDVALARLTYRITVRGAPQGSPARPRPGQRFRDAGRVFPIVAVSEATPDGTYLVCYAQEEVAL